MTLGIDPDCHYGDHTYHGGGICMRCYKPLRCSCGQFMREDGIDAHLERCPRIAAQLRAHPEMEEWRPER